MEELAWVIKFVLHTNLLKLNKFCLKYETFQESRLVVARQVTMAGLSKRNLTHNRTCIKDICTETIIFVTSNAFSRSCQLGLRFVPCCSTEDPKTRGNVVRENNLKQNISWYCWPFFSAVKLLPPLPILGLTKTAVLIVKLSGCRYLFGHKSLVKSVA